ncbi:MAG: hypothetical protein EA374_03045 [Acholeplasmatales bacterium]|nr:MAG: hypothetical protein EA374_03045 [Acholeplasmatales bacterium]
MKKIIHALVTLFQMLFYVGSALAALAFVFQFFTDIITFRTFGNILLTTIGFYIGYFLFYRLYYWRFAQETYETLPEQIDALESDVEKPKE